MGIEWLYFTNLSKLFDIDRTWQTDHSLLEHRLKLLDEVMYTHHLLHHSQGGPLKKAEQELSLLHSFSASSSHVLSVRLPHFCVLALDWMTS